MTKQVESGTQHLFTNGIVYVATGSSLGEAVASVTSLRACMPDVHVTLFTDARPGDGLFDHCVLIDQPRFSSLDKVRNLQHTPYERTIYLDSDTLVAEPLDDLFHRLDEVDLLATIEVGRGYWYEGQIAVPKSFPELNTGVMAFRKTPKTVEILSNWEDEYLQSVHWQQQYEGRTWDQPSFRKLLWEARKEMKLGILPTEYNVLATWGSFLHGDPVIIHARHKPKRWLRRIRKHRLTDRVLLGEMGCLRSPYDMSFGEWLATLLRVQVVFLKALFFKLFRLRHGPAVSAAEEPRKT